MESNYEAKEREAMHVLMTITNMKLEAERWGLHSLRVTASKIGWKVSAVMPLTEQKILVEEPTLTESVRKLFETARLQLS